MASLECIVAISDRLLFAHLIQRSGPATGPACLESTLLFLPQGRSALLCTALLCSALCSALPLLVYTRTFTRAHRGSLPTPKRIMRLRTEQEKAEGKWTRAAISPVYFLVKFIIMQPRFVCVRSWRRWGPGTIRGRRASSPQMETHAGQGWERAVLHMQMQLQLFFGLFYFEFYICNVQTSQYANSV